MKLQDLFQNARTGLCAVALTAIAALSSCGKDDSVVVLSIPGGPSGAGHVTFQYKNHVFHDYGFDGTLDRVIYHNGYERIEVTDPEKLKEFQALYIEAREKATKGE